MAWHEFQMRSDGEETVELERREQSQGMLGE